MLSVDKISAGGSRLLLRTSFLLLAASALTSAALGFPVDIAMPTMSVVLGSIPLLVTYPLAISSVTYSLAVKLARKNRQLDELGRTDALTGLANRRQGIALAEAELARFPRTPRLNCWTLRAGVSEVLSRSGCMSPLRAAMKGYLP